MKKNFGTEFDLLEVIGNGAFSEVRKCRYVIKIYISSVDKETIYKDNLTEIMAKPYALRKNNKKGTFFYDFYKRPLVHFFGRSICS